MFPNHRNPRSPIAETCAPKSQFLVFKKNAGSLANSQGVNANQSPPCPFTTFFWECRTSSTEPSASLMWRQFACHGRLVILLSVLLLQGGMLVEYVKTVEEGRRGQQIWGEMSSPLVTVCFLRG